MITTWWSAIYIWKNEQVLHEYVGLGVPAKQSGRPWRRKM